MKYIRTKDSIINFDNLTETSKDFYELYPDTVIKQADTIEELCDEFDIIIPAGIYRTGIYHMRFEGYGDFKRAWRDFKEKNGDDYRHYEILGAYGAIWTDKGLIYVAKMNDKGELDRVVMTPYILCF